MPYCIRYIKPILITGVHKSGRMVAFRIKTCISAHAPNRKHQLTVKFTGHYRTVGPQYGTCFVLPNWRLECGGVILIIVTFVDLCLT